MLSLSSDRGHPRADLLEHGIYRREEVDGQASDPRPALVTIAAANFRAKHGNEEAGSRALEGECGLALLAFVEEVSPVGRTKLRSDREQLLHPRVEADIVGAEEAEAW